MLTKTKALNTFELNTGSALAILVAVGLLTLNAIVLLGSADYYLYSWNLVNYLGF